MKCDTICAFQDLSSHFLLQIWALSDVSNLIREVGNDPYRYIPRDKNTVVHELASRVFDFTYSFVRCSDSMC